MGAHAASNMELSREVTSGDKYDHKCKKCGRAIWLLPAFFKMGFTFPMQLRCKGCNEVFEINFNKVEIDVEKLRVEHENKISSNKIKK